MPVGPVSYANFTHMVVRTGRSAFGSPATTTATSDREREERLQIEFLARQLGDLKSSLETLRTSWKRKSTAQEVHPARALSRSELGLQGATAASLASSEEINTTPTSFTPLGPDWSGTSTAVATVGGEYDGDQGDDTLTFTVSRGGTIGNRLLIVSVTDGQGADIDEFRIRRTHQPGQIYTLDNGLEVSFTAGDLDLGDSFTVDVSASTGTAVDPDRPFDGVRNDDPLLESGFAVTAGSFTVNGQTVNVAADDTVNMVLQAINQSGAGVTASFDVASETISLLQNTPGASHLIDLGADSSGFLAAMKLDSANVVDGQDADVDRPLADIFAGLSAGNLLINGVAIAVDPIADSLTDLIDRINASAAGAIASLDPSGQRLQLVSNDEEAPLNLDDNGVGLLPAVDVEEGDHFAVTARRVSRMGSVRARDLADALRDAFAAINAIFSDDLPGGEPAEFIENARKDLLKALGEGVETDARDLARDLGLRIDFDEDEEIVGNLLPDSRRFEKALTKLFRKRTDAAERLLFGSGKDSGEGLLGQLEIRRGAILNSLVLTAGYRGLSLDSYA